VRDLAQPRVLRLASLAALATALASYPRLSLWVNRAYPIWYLEAVLFFCSTVLWSFVFAWHHQYSHRPVFTTRQEPGPFLTATLAGIAMATAFHFFVDPSLRLKVPEEYPADPKQWLAMTLFALTFNQLFLVFAPYAWLVRLSKNRQVATGLTVLFGAIVLTVKTGSLSHTPIPSLWLAALLAVRIGMEFLCVSFYLRGGMLLSWWWTLLLEARYGFDFMGNS
jgi:hypothetical protein